MTDSFDVAIIGGGPGGSTLACLLKKHNPALRVLVLEKEKFPRDHIGESQLPPIGKVLIEMGCWDKVEAAGFPIKVGVTFTWGKTTDPWDFHLFPLSEMDTTKPRPHRFENWRQRSSFQVDRAIYDKILLDHARELGCDVREETRVASIERDGDRVVALTLGSGETVTARHYVDASGNVGILRRAMGVKVDAPTALQNIAFWDYWENPRWLEVEPVGRTRVHIRSLPYGWMWFIPVSATRASVGLVTPASYYKESGKRPAEIFAQALEDEKWVKNALEGGAPRGKVESTTDWSYVVERCYGENWFLVGEVAGFADPILSAGMTLTQTGALELAYTILELDRAEHDREWLLARYDDLQRRRVLQHMRFAEYWYSANGVFDNIRENCVKIAEEAGLKLNPAEAFKWLAQGGFGDDIPGQVGLGGLDIAGVKQVMMRITGDQATWKINGKNVFKLNLQGAKKVWIGRPNGMGRIERAEAYLRGHSRLELIGVQKTLFEILQKHSDIDKILESLRNHFAISVPAEHIGAAVQQAIQVLEVMATDYWVHASVRKGRPALQLATPEEGQLIHTHDESGLLGRVPVKA